MVLVVAAVLLAMLLIAALVLNGRQIVNDEVRLPIGADAALWSILEVIPDPRNHLALTRDLTGEVRIAGTILDPAFVPQPVVRNETLLPPPPPVPAGRSSVRILTASELEAEDKAVRADRLHRAS